MAYVRKLPSGKFQATVRHPSGRRLTKTDPLKRAVQAWANDLEAKYRNGDVTSERGRTTTLQQWHDEWIKARNVAATTAHEERLRLDKYVLPEWGAWPLRTIRRVDVQAWVKRLGEERSPHVAFGCYQVFHKMLGDAELDGLITVTPCRSIELPKRVLPAPRWLTHEEYGRLLLAFHGAPQGDQWRAMVAVACHSGLRSGELSGLDVGAIDFERGLVRVGQVMTKYGLRPYPKSDSSRRTVPVHPSALEMLWPTVADKSADAPAFPAPRGGRLDQSNFLKTVWHPALQRADIEPVRAYVTRHTFASWMVQAGVPLAEIAHALGHRSLGFINRYAFLQPDAHHGIRAAWSRIADADMTHAAVDAPTETTKSARQSPAIGL